MVEIILKVNETGVLEIESEGLTLADVNLWLDAAKDVILSSIKDEESNGQ